ncbi:putative U3 small nucleolar RNA-associated protein 13 [Ceratocystis platani]|uniref:Putative U3 small nucleolar RNA-associated protein 13 n=1 Tax=Ceratocystis fimbriata f. sp. platani TaxID=88771 RepID=A0A0F8B2Z2_CERFI|nr:putative U3 small nucleolar RNA-associated protein 13 [Ceratocystis platani]
MATKQPLKTTFDVDKVLQPIFTGGAVAIDDDARILATVLEEDVVLTDPSTGQNLARIEGDTESVSTIALTPSGSHLIICSRSLSMHIYALKRSPDNINKIVATRLRTVKPHTTPINVVAVDKTGTLLATGGTDGIIKVWDITKGFVTHTFRGPSGLVTALHFFEVVGRAAENSQKKSKKANNKKSTADNESNADANVVRFRLASGSQDGKIRIWDLHKRSVAASLDSHVSDVTAIDFCPEQQTIVSASRDKTIIWWDTRSWKQRKVVPCLELIEAAGFVDGGRLTYCAGSKGNLRIFDTDTGVEYTPEQEEKMENEAVVRGVYRPSLPFIICSLSDHTICLFKNPSKDDMGALSQEPVPFRRISGTHDEIIDLGYLLPDHSMLALATNSEDIRIVSVKDSSKAASDEGSSWMDSGDPYFGQDVALLHGHEDIIITLDIDWSGHWVATGAKDNTARLWRVDPANNSYECYAVFSGHAESIGAVGLPKGVPQETSAAYKDPLNHPPAFLITGSQDQTVKRWDIPRQKPDVGSSSKPLRAAYTRKAHDKDINAIDVHHTNQLFGSASQDKTVKIWSVQDGEVQGILKGHKRGVWTVRFAPPKMPSVLGEEGSVAGRGLVMTGSGDKTIKLWNLTDYSCIRTMEGHSHSILKVAWLNVPKTESAQKKILVASAGGDGLVKVWDANTGETECTLDNHEDRVWALAVNPDTNTLVSGSGDSTVTFWKDTTVETQTKASQAALQLIEQEQELENHIHAGSYREAITLALQLNHPGRLLSLFTKVTSSATPDADSLSGLVAVDEVLASLSDEQLFMLLQRLRDWNTNGRTAPVAQRILWALLKSYPASKFANLSVRGARGQKSLREVLDALKAYSERHYKRIEELVDESYLVEYTLYEMNSLMPALEEAMDDKTEAEESGDDGDIIMT